MSLYFGGKSDMLKMVAKWRSFKEPCPTLGPSKAKRLDALRKLRLHLSRSITITPASASTVFALERPDDPAVVCTWGSITSSNEHGMTTRETTKNEDFPKTGKVAHGAPDLDQLLCGRCAGAPSANFATLFGKGVPLVSYS